MIDPTDSEIEHGVELLREASADTDWAGGVALIPIDEVCKVKTGGGARCGAPVRNALVLPFRDLEGCHVIALCDHHTICLQAAVERWRELD